MPQNKPIGRRSSMEIAIDSRLLGVIITIFILILTIKSEVLNYAVMTAQLVLAIPFLLGAMISNSRIVNNQTLQRYLTLNRVCSAIAFALIFNTIGLLISKYVSLTLGMLFFLGFIMIMTIFIFIDIDKSTWRNKLLYEVLMMVLMIAFGIIPALELI
jgi:hypothetical protein